VILNAVLDVQFTASCSLCSALCSYFLVSGIVLGVEGTDCTGWQKGCKVG